MFRSRLSLSLLLSVFATPNAVMGAPLLPNLTVSGSSVQVLGSGSSRAIYFSTISTNQGTGPLELRVVATYPDGHEDVNQRIYDSNGTYTEQYAGTFVYHAAHGHIHFEDFAYYNLREVTADGGVGAIVAGSEKISFCLLDTSRMASPPPGSPTSAVYGGSGPGTYPACSNSVQGLSVGWSDLYSYTLEGQSISLNRVSGGTYWLELVSDPTNRLAESNDTDNTWRGQYTFTTSFSPEINVTGNAQPILSGDLAPTSADGTDFGSVDVATDSLTRTFTIANTGTGTLSLTGVPRVQVTGANASDFIVSVQPISPVADINGTSTFQIRFVPTAPGLRTASVTIVNNDSDEDSYQFAIQGNGVPDTDGDGEDDISEAASGTNPNNADSFIRSGKQLNISTRLDVQTGSNVGIGGFIINGSDPKPVLVRALGPSLSAAGVLGALADPTLELRDNAGALITSNNNWKDSQQAAIQNTGLAPGNDLEAAMLQTLVPGAYTAIVRGNGSTSGIGLIEVYDVDRTVNSTLANVSTRGLVGTGQSVMIGGEIIGGGLGANESGSAGVLFRARGPSLPASIANRLADPTLELRDGNGATITSNDDWRIPDEADIQGTGLAPTDDHESAILAIVTKGNYTAILRGKDGSVGVAIIEAFKVQ